ncbi:MAG: hypothetical protein Q9218_001407 [Villophora microphyllina]
MDNREEANAENLSEDSPLLSKPRSTTSNGTLEAASDRDAYDEEDTPLADEPTTRQLLLIMGSIWLGCFLAALDSTIIATLSAPISTSFHSLSLLSWLASAYLIANAALQPLSGRLTDILGRRAGLIFSNIFFAAGNLICGLAQDEWTMIFGRVVAGMGGGGLTAISTFVGSDLVPLRKRGLWQGFGNVFYGIGAGLGGVFGGYINDTLGWRIAFLIQVPFTVLSGLLVFFTVRIPIKVSDQSTWKRIDFLGALTLIFTLVLLLLGINSGGNIVSWTHPLVLVSLPLSALSMLAFIYVEANHASEPVIPVRLLLDRTVLSACLTNWFTTMCQFSILFYGPIYFQVKGLSATAAGARLIPSSVGVGFGSVGSGLLMRWTGRYYYLSIVSQVIFLVSLAMYATMQLNTPAWEPFLAFLLMGIGYSGMLTITLLALIAAVAHTHQAVITSASYAFRSTGSTIGMAIASAVFQNILHRRLQKRFPNSPDLIDRLRDSLDEIKNLPPDLKGGAMDVYMEALRGVFLTILGIGVLGAVVSLFMREHTLHANLARSDTTKRRDKVPTMSLQAAFSPSSPQRHDLAIIVSLHICRSCTYARLLVLPLPIQHSSLHQTWVRYIALPVSQRRIVSPIRVIRYRHTKDGADSNVVDIVPVIFTAGDRYHTCAYHRHKSEEYAEEIRASTEDVKLTGKKQAQIPKSSECETAVSAWKATPAIMQRMVVFLGTDFVGDQLMLGGSLGWFAASQKIWARPTYGILRDVGDEGGQEKRSEEAEDCDLGFVEAVVRWRRGDNCGSKKYEKEWKDSGIEDVVIYIDSQ